MDVQFEVSGEIVEAGALADRLGESAAVVLRRLVDRMRIQVNVICAVHHEVPVVTIAVSDGQSVSVRVSGCCQPFLARVQEQVKHIFAEVINQPPSARPGTSLVIGVQGTNKTFTFEMARVDRLVIGRLDPDTGERPDIDLSAYGAYRNGVSRCHASIVLRNRALFLVDEGSPNGTFLNEERLRPGEPHALKFGDQIRVGRLVLHVMFDDSYHVTTSSDFGNFYTSVSWQE